MLEKGHTFLKKQVKRVIFLADAGFRGCDWAQLCLQLGWKYAIRVACNTYITLPDGTSERLDHVVPENCNRYFQNVLLTRETKLRTNVSVTWTTDKNVDLEHTRLQHAERIDHLLLAMAIATLWCHELGEFVLKQGDDLRCLVDPARKRTLSLFQLGLPWLKRSLATGFLALPDFQAILFNLKLKPVVIPITLNSNV